MGFIWFLVFVAALVLFLGNMVGLALFLLGVGMFLESGNWLWILLAVAGAAIMSSTD